MKKIILLSIFIPSLLFSQWVQQTVPPDIQLVLSIDFANINTGAASGWGGSFIGKAVYTTNSGANWLLAQVPDSSRSLVEVQLIDANTGYIAGAYNVPAGNTHLSRGNVVMNNIMRNYYERIGMTGPQEDYRGLFLKTTDGGRTWFTLDHLPANVYYLMGMKFINVSIGFVSASLEYSGGIRNAVLKTTNGGLNWNSLYTIDTCDINNIYTSDGSIIFISGFKSYYGNIYDGMMLRTTNGGSLWNVQLFSQINMLSDVSFSNSTTGFTVSSMGNGLIDTLYPAKVYKTTNTGTNWIKLAFENPFSSYEGVGFVPGTGKGIAVGYKTSNEFVINNLLITRTTDYGSSWSNYLIADSFHLLISTCLVDANNWFVCGGGLAGPVIYKSSNGGAPIGIKPISSEIPNQFSLSQNYPNPFNPATKIKFSIPLSRGVSARLRNGQEGRGAPVKLAIYDALGRDVTVLVNQELKPGTYEVEWNGNNYPSGVYFCKLTSRDYAAAIKLILLK